jgi:prephenate dehydrogenase
VGLIGGSAALALRRAGLVGHVTGVGRSRANLDEALRLGILDAATDDYAGALAGADVVLVTTPVAQMPAVFAQIAPHLQPATVVTDGGSTTQDVIAAARAALGAKFAQFVPGHPIAGTEHTGAAAAFRSSAAAGSCWRRNETDAAATPRRGDVGATGASVALMPAAPRHLATVSHLRIARFCAGRRAGAASRTVRSLPAASATSRGSPQFTRCGAISRSPMRRAAGELRGRNHRTHGGCWPRPMRKAWERCLPTREPGTGSPASVERCRARHGLSISRRRAAGSSLPVCITIRALLAALAEQRPPRRRARNPDTRVMLVRFRAGRRLAQDRGAHRVAGAGGPFP